MTMRYHVILVCDQSDLYVLNRRTLRSAVEWCTEALNFTHPDIDRAAFIMGRTPLSTGRPLGFRVLVTDDGVPVESWRVFEDDRGRVSLQLIASSPPDRDGPDPAGLPRLLP